MRTVRSARLLVVVAVVAFAACRDDAPDETATDTAADTAATPEVIVNEVPLEEVADSVVTATFTDGALTLQPNLVGRGTVTIMIENQDDEPHALELVSRTGGRWRSLPAPPGSSGMSLSMVLNAGEHDVYSATGRERGMEAVLTVR
jgi:hypothetical protein